jgi:hypothetical protein
VTNNPPGPALLVTGGDGPETGRNTRLTSVRRIGGKRLPPSSVERGYVTDGPFTSVTEGLELLRQIRSAELDVLHPDRMRPEPTRRKATIP